MNALSVVSRSCSLMRPEVPGKSQRTPTGRSHSFGSVQGIRVRCGLVLVDRRSGPNERQRALLERLAAGEEHPAAWAPGEWRSAYALRDRGLLRINRGGGEALVEVTEDGRYYLRHGRRPEEPTSAEGATRRHPPDLLGAGAAPSPTPNGPSLVRDEPRRPSWSSGCSPRGVSVSPTKTGSMSGEDHRLCEATRTGTSRQTDREGPARGRRLGAVPQRGATSQLTEPEVGGRRLGGSGSHAADFSSSGRGRAQRRGGAARDASCASAPGTPAPAGAGSRGGTARLRRTGNPGVLLGEGGWCERCRRRLRL
ncbi:hypothetical protein KE639_01237 [Streptomyces sp. V17-9]|nr:hypothetical protein KE639_01237 [Streptomyces sp. V17-9]